MFTKRLQAIRKKLNLSQEEISTQIGISYRAYTSYERGDRKPSIDFLEKLVGKYNVNLNYLIAGVGDMFITSAKQFEQEQDVFAQRVRELIGEEFKARGL